VRTRPKIATRILIVEDEDLMRETLRDLLQTEGYDVVEARDGAAMYACLERERIDLITLDIKLDGEDGFALARDVHARRNLPIVMISGRADLIDRVIGLELGADDYISKPFHAREVLARVRAVLRRHHSSQNARLAVDGNDASNRRYVFDGWSVDLGRRELTSPDKNRVPLTAAEFNLLVVFVTRPHRVLTREAILDHLKGHAFSPFDRTVDGLIARLRRKLDDDASSPRIIKTVRSAGYVFACDVHCS
jgi:two-component system, OmpR family, response regulator